MSINMPMNFNMMGITQIPMNILMMPILLLMINMKLLMIHILTQILILMMHTMLTMTHVLMMIFCFQLLSRRTSRTTQTRDIMTNQMMIIIQNP